jgi:GTP-binding protein HflX
LKDIGADQVPQWLIFNKIDALPEDRRPAFVQDVYLFEGLSIPRIFLSARSGLNLDSLRQRLLEHSHKQEEERLTLLPADLTA